MMPRPRRSWLTIAAEIATILGLILTLAMLAGSCSA